MNDQRGYEMIREWLAASGGDAAHTARWMSRTLHLGTPAQCRALITEALRRSAADALETVRA